MKIRINKNILWSQVFIGQLVKLGVKNACISPGSRNTPITYAIAANRQISTSVFVDERSSAFYALGIAKQTNSPVLIVTTSGTAVAELYPAIIEAYKSRTPLIICTADRPPYLRNKGANQTINQHEIYKNHIRYFAELSLPGITEKALAKLKKETIKAFSIALTEDRGPVHLNFPFEKPFEPDSFTDVINNELLKKIWIFNKTQNQEAKTKSREIKSVKSLTKTISRTPKGIILCGSGNYKSSFPKLLNQFSKRTGYPLIADGATGFRFGKGPKQNLIENFTALCRPESFMKKYDPEIIIQFGTAPTSISILEFYKNSKADKYLIDQYGDWNDPSLTAKQVIQCSPDNFCSLILSGLAEHKPSNEWLRTVKSFDLAAGKIKDTHINNQIFPFEGRIVNEIISSLPDKCNLMISNSLPVRDFDSFANASARQINVFTNRGASGIDGIISTSLGIASQSALPTYLIIGDLAFFHDLNSLSSAVRKSIPLKIILVNNNGGGIFEHLPISRYRQIFDEYFKTPLNMDFEKVIEGYGCAHHLIMNWSDLRARIKNSYKSRLTEVFEVNTDSALSLEIRKAYWHLIESLE